MRVCSPDDYYSTHKRERTYDSMSSCERRKLLLFATRTISDDGSGSLRLSRFAFFPLLPLSLSKFFRSSIFSHLFFLSHFVYALPPEATATAARRRRRRRRRRLRLCKLPKHKPRPLLACVQSSIYRPESRAFVCVSEFLCLLKVQITEVAVAVRVEVGQRVWTRVPFSFCLNSNICACARVRRQWNRNSGVCQRKRFVRANADARKSTFRFTL